MKSVEVSNLELLQFESITIPHAVTTRQGGVSSNACASLNVGQHRHDTDTNIAENRRRVCHALGLDPDRFAAMHQVHSDNIAIVDHKAQMKGIANPLCAVPETDGMITNRPGLTLMAKAADCPSVILHDPELHVLAVLHSGWRGTFAGIASKAVQMMTKHFGSSPANVRAGIGPGISVDHYEVSGDLVQRFSQRFPCAVSISTSRNGKHFLDLSRTIAHQLQQAGVKQIESAGLCTYADKRFFSHRRDGEKAGRTGLFACL